MTNKLIAPFKTQLDEGNAYWMAVLSKAVYSSLSKSDRTPDEMKILADLRQLDSKFVSVVGFNKNSAQGAVIEHQDYLTLTFRGTDETADWLDNLNAFSTKNLFGEFHRGFWNSLEDLWPEMQRVLAQMQNESIRPLFITGHSLGGAMASIAAARYVHDDLPFTSVYTFGQPRAMTRDTAQIFNMECKSRYFRFHNNNDIVTRVPARLMGYSHVGSYLYISEERVIYEEPGYWFRFLDHVDGAISAIKEAGIDAVEDHDMNRYLAAVSEWQLD